MLGELVVVVDRVFVDCDVVDGEFFFWWHFVFELQCYFGCVVDYLLVVFDGCAVGFRLVCVVPVDHVEFDWFMYCYGLVGVCKHVDVEVEV